MPFTQQALEMRKRLHKNQDHPDLATSLSNMGTLLKAMGQDEKVLSFTPQIVEMQHRLFLPIPGPS